MQFNTITRGVSVSPLNRGGEYFKPKGSEILEDSRGFHAHTHPDIHRACERETEDSSLVQTQFICGSDIPSTTYSHTTYSVVLGTLAGFCRFLQADRLEDGQQTYVVCMYMRVCVCT